MYGVCVSTHVCMCAHIHVGTAYLIFSCTYIHIYVHVYACTYRIYIRCGVFMHVCMCTHIHVRIYIYVYVYIQIISTCIHVRTCMCIQSCMYKCVCVFAQTQSCSSLELWTCLAIRSSLLARDWVLILALPPAPPLPPPGLFLAVMMEL